jgi:hypothetical protein
MENSPESSELPRWQCHINRFYRSVLTPFHEPGFNKVNGLANQSRKAREPLLPRCDGVDGARAASGSMKGRAKMVVVEQPFEGAPSMGKSITDLSPVTTVGLDLAKHVFQVHGIDASGRVVVANAIRRNKLLEFFASLAPCLVGLEASGSAHYWARELMALGHEARIMPPAYVKPYISSAEERRLGCGGNLRGGDAAFDAVCRRALAHEPGGVDASQGAGDAGHATHVASQWAARPLNRGRRHRSTRAEMRSRTGRVDRGLRRDNPV